MHMRNDAKDHIYSEHSFVTGVLGEPDRDCISVNWT